jgi:hypothetical protein
MCKQVMSGRSLEEACFDTNFSDYFTALSARNFTKTKSICQANFRFLRKMLSFLRLLYEVRSGNGDFRKVMTDSAQEPRKIGLM